MSPGLATGAHLF